MAKPHDSIDMDGAALREPPRLTVILNAFGGGAIICAILFFGGSFYVQNEIGRAFCLGAFFSGLLGAIVLFGFAKIIDMLDALRDQTLSESAPLPSAQPPPERPRASTGSRA